MYDKINDESVKAEVMGTYCKQSDPRLAQYQVALNRAIKAGGYTVQSGLTRALKTVLQLQTMTSAVVPSYTVVLSDKHYFIISG